MELAFSCAWLAVAVWLIARAFNQRGLFKPLEPASPPVPNEAADVAVIVPARDEQANIGRCLGALIGQNYPAGHCRILVVDDHSDDATVVQATLAAGGDPRVRVMRSPPLPLGWVGKSHACWIGAGAVPADTEWLCFTDADVWAEPGLLSGAVATATSEDLDLLSLAPRQQLESLAERLMIPCGLYLLAFCQDFRTLHSDDSNEARITGQFMLVRHRAYKAVGGHAAVKGAICEDMALARRLRQAGKRVTLRDGNGLLTTRMYTGWAPLWVGISKNLVDMLGGPIPTIIIAAVATVLAWAAWLIPAIDSVSCARAVPGACLALLPGLIGSTAAFGLHLAGASYFRLPVWYGLIFPFGYTAGALMAIDSVRRRLRGCVRWKGRTYP